MSFFSRFAYGFTHPGSVFHTAQAQNDKQSTYYTHEAHTHPVKTIAEGLAIGFAPLSIGSAVGAGAVGAGAEAGLGSAVGAESGAIELQPLLSEEASASGAAQLGTDTEALLNQGRLANLGSSAEIGASQTSQLSRLANLTGSDVLRGLGASESAIQHATDIAKLGAKAATLVGVGASVADLVKLNQVSKQEGGVNNQLNNIGNNLNNISNQLNNINPGAGEAIGNAGQNINQLSKQIENISQINNQNVQNELTFQQNIQGQVNNEEQQLRAALTDVSERLEESYVKDYNYSTFVDFISRFDNPEETVDFLARHEASFEKLSEAEQNNILDLLISQGA